MEANRIPSGGSQRKKPKVILDKQFPFASTLELGDKGQLDAVVEVDSMYLRDEEDGNEMKTYVFKINKAEMLDQRGVRV